MISITIVRFVNKKKAPTSVLSSARLRRKECHSSARRKCKHEPKVFRNDNLINTPCPPLTNTNPPQVCVIPALVVGTTTVIPSLITYCTPTPTITSGTTTTRASCASTKGAPIAAEKSIKKRQLAFR